MADEQRVSVVPALCARGVLLIGVLLVFLGTLFVVPPGATVWIVLGMGVYAIGDGVALLLLVNTRPHLFVRAEPPRRNTPPAPAASPRDIETLRSDLDARLAKLEAAVADLAGKLDQAPASSAPTRRRRR